VGTEQLGITGEEGLLSSSTSRHPRNNWHGEYVILTLVEKAADAVLSQRRASSSGQADSLYTFEGFRKAFSFSADNSERLMGEMDARVLLKYLERDKGVVVADKGVRI
jgi:charged multivesicular body protein 7